jgi:hypothetical protein
MIYMVAGTVEKVSGNEVIIRYKNPDDLIVVGEILHIKTGDKPIKIKVSFPMQTSAKCSIDNGDVRFIRSVKKGMNVYYVQKDHGIVFRNVGDGTVTDEKAGLMWTQNANIMDTDGVSWDDAITYCNELRLGGYDDWRLPTPDELYTQISYHYQMVRDPNSGHIVSTIEMYFNNIGDGYWSSREDSNDSKRAFCVFINKTISIFGKNEYQLLVWPVRNIKKPK